MKLWRATQRLENAARFEEAKKLQGLASLGEAAILKIGVRSTALSRYALKYA
jgi:hypothetical protein